MAKAVVEIVGDARSFILATRQSVTASDTLKRQFSELSLSAGKSAEAQVKASVLRTSRLREEITEVQRLAATYVRGSRESVAALELLERKQAQLNRMTGAGFAAGRGGSRLRRDEREASGLTRGALSGAGLGKVGFSALAGGTFFGAFLGTSAVKASIDAATEAVAVEKQLANQYRVAGLNLGDYRKQIDATIGRLSALAGFNKDELAQSFTAIFRASGDTTKSLQYLGVAANLARGRHMELQAAALLVAKVVNGNVGILKRYGIEVHKGETATEALAAVQAKYSGAAAAGTTAQQKFSAELHNSEVIIGTTLLPTVTHLLSEGSRWLAQMNESGKLQRDLNTVVRDGAVVVGILKGGLQALTGAVRLADDLTGSFKNTLKLLAGVALLSKLSGWTSGIQGVGSQAEIASGKVATLRGKLANLAAIGTIVIGIDILEKLIPPNATRGGQSILKSEGLGGLGNIPLVGPALQAGAYYGRQTGKALGLKYGDQPTNGVPSKYLSSIQETEAYLAGKQGNGYPFPLNAMGSGGWLAAYLAGRKAGPHHVGGGKKPPPAAGGGSSKTAAGYSLSNIQSINLALSKNPNDPAAIRAKLAYDERAAAFAEKRIRQGRGSNDLVASLQSVYADEQSLRNQLTEMDKKNAAGIAKSARERAAAAKKAIDAAKKAAELRDTRTAERILGIGPHPRTSVQQSLALSERGTLNAALAQAVYGKAGKTQLAAITKRTADLSTGQLVQLAKSELGDNLSAATLGSLEKINKVLKLKFLPADVVANLRARLAQIKQTLAGGLASLNTTAGGYKGVSAAQFVDGIPGLTRAQKVALEQKYSQVEAHGGAPRGPAIAGIPTVGGTAIHVQNMTVTGVENLDHLITQIEKRTRHKVQRGGVRR